MTWDQWVKVIAAACSLLAAVFGYLARRNVRTQGDRITKQINDIVWPLIAERMTDAANRAGPDQTHVIRLAFLSGNFIAVPLTREWIEIDRSLARIQLLGTNSTETEYQLSCPNPYQIESHTHPETEIARVERGQMIDLDTGKRYGVGASWEIPANMPHRVFFAAGTRVSITVRPPLPLNSEVPLSLDGLPRIS